VLADGLGQRGQIVDPQIAPEPDDGGAHHEAYGKAAA
jgi:hypothetical protein